MKKLTFKEEETRKILEDGYILAIPTETVYGIGVRWDDEKAYDRLCEAKHRRPTKPIAVMTSMDFDFEKYFVISEGAKRVMKKFLPGPLTVLVKAKDNAPYQTHLGTYIAGIRVPAKKELLEFLASLPFPLQVTSANMSGESSTPSYSDVLEIFKDTEAVRGIVEGSCESGTPTTVVDLTKDTPVVIREGDISLKQIETAFYNI